MVSGYLVLTGVNEPYHGCPISKMLLPKNTGCTMEFHIGIHGGVDVRAVTKTTLSRTDGLPYFLTHGAPRVHSGIIKICSIVYIDWQLKWWGRLRCFFTSW